MSKKVIFDRPNVLVTGGAGFIGSHLCDALVKEANVICIDNLITSEIANIEHLLQNPHFEFLNHDITQPLHLSAFPELEAFKIVHQGVQEIYHLACPISKRHFDDFKIAMALTNSIGTKHILDVAVEHKSKVLYASSSVLYGNRHQKEFAKESDECLLNHLTTRGAYDEGKRFSESLLQTYAEVYGLDVKIARIFRTYGTRMKIFDGNLIPDMILNALDGEDIVISGDEESRTSLANVKDVVDGMTKLMSSPVEITLMNLGSDKEVRLVNIAQKIVDLTQSASRIRFEVPTGEYINAGLPDISRARDLLAWMPLVQLEDGLREMIDYSRSHKQLITT